MATENNTLTTDLIESLCKRGFGSNVQIESIKELNGGTFNTAYLITFRDQLKVVLRVAPPQPADTYWEEAFLMRREHSVQPFFAPIATLMPKTLLIDFTHQLIGRDYMFQSFIEGERWDGIMDALTPAANNVLWNQFGEILRRIHNVRGDKFGLPISGFQFSSWSQTVIDRLERTLLAAQKKQFEIPHLASILERIRIHPHLLDEIQIPRLLHGDLWSFNILITQDANGPAIAGVLDADRAWWGDPMADWTLFILKHAEKEEGHSHFWKTYGRFKNTTASKCRSYVYDAMHAGTAFVWATQHQDDETVMRAQGTLSEAAAALQLCL